ncbi:MAG TPA: ATP-grasp domain-containing protein [Candidatus Limnocylindria bacterium]|nr:ATP-grasp domain-containing protein [Candidatus Limnocylindria bacterium]
MTSPKLRVAVLLGGNSNERETSFDSGRNVVYKLSPHKYEAIPVFVSSSMKLYRLTLAQLVYNSTREVEESLAPAHHIAWSDLPSVCDFVFIGLHGGLGENGGVQGALEMLGVPYNGSSVLASALCMDKFKTTHYLKSQGFEVPQSMLISQEQWHNDVHGVMHNITTTLSFPFIIKPHDDGCSVMVHKITKQEDIEPVVTSMFAQGKTQVMVEEFIRGMELTVGVIGNQNPQALPPSQTVAVHGVLSMEEKFLPGAGENQTPAPLPRETLALVQRTVEAAYVAIGCKGYARIDCFYQTAEQSRTGKERVVILEFNTLPAMTPATCLFHQAAEVGLKPMDFVDLIVKFGLEEHGKSKQDAGVTVSTDNKYQQAQK